MKRLYCLLLALVLVLAMAPAVRADVIYIPEDDFLEDHMFRCIEVRRSFRALTDVKVYQSPESATVKGTLAQGDAVHIYYQYVDDQRNRWGYVEDYETRIYGWVPMAYLELIYDYISFKQDYGHLFREEEWELPAEYAKSEIRFWKYPGSEVFHIFKMAEWGGDWMPSSSTLYTDQDGREWAFIGYYYGHQDAWICVSDPTADFETLYPSGAPEVEITEPGETEPTIPDVEIKPNSSLSPVAVGVGVVLCVAVTAVILVNMKKKKN